MKYIVNVSLVGIIIFIITACKTQAPSNDPLRYLQISGIYPHLTAYNLPTDSNLISRHRECGIGVVVPWAEKLWYLTYPPHMRTGSNDKLYMVDKDLKLTIRSESIGGTHANRMVHKESNQLIMGPYVIDAAGKVRGADVHQLEGRMTATTRHLNDPENKVLFYEMEGHVYEMDVNSLAVNKLFEKPVPGWHGKGAYVGQGRFIVANNGEHQGHAMGYSKLLVGGEAKNAEEAGVLAEWDGTSWRIIERKQFTDVTGPGGIYGNDMETDPVWSMGWDKRSVILKLLDRGEWYTYRLPKGSHTFDPRHGWFTEWPRIREISNDQMLMVMHGSMFDFPKGFSRASSGNIHPIATHLRYIPDFCAWNGKLVLAADDASTLQNPIVGQPQSNLWFGSVEELRSFGPRVGWGGVWLDDEVKAETYSDPFLLNGYKQRAIHLSHTANIPVTFTLEIDKDGTNNWQAFSSIKVAAKAYKYELLPVDLDAAWMRIKTDQNCQATAYFHYYSVREAEKNTYDMFTGLADAGEAAIMGLIRPAGHNRSLQFLKENGEYVEISLSEDSLDLYFDQTASSRVEEVKQIAKIDQDIFRLDKASVIVQSHDGINYRLPKGPSSYDVPTPQGFPRALREVQSERFLANIHGMFYEIPRAEGASRHIPDFQKIKPVSRHNKMIFDYCSWRGLLVLSGTKPDAKEDGQVFSDEQGNSLWFGQVDDIWKMDKPGGIGGPWKETPIKANEVSDPYLMTGFDQKKVLLSHDEDQTISFTLEVAINHEEWKVYKQIEVPPAKEVEHIFPTGFHAHWVRLRSDHACKASAIFVYK